MTIPQTISNINNMNADELKDWLISQQQKWKHKAETLGKDNIAYIDIRNCQWAYNFVLEELENDMYKICLKSLIKRSEIIKESEILAVLPYELHNDWDNFMRGKTCPILDTGDHGVYSWDLNQFINIIEKSKPIL